MKKTLALILALLFILLLTSCTAKTASPAAEPNQWGVLLQVENATSKGVTLVCSHTGGENVSELSTGSFFILQKEDNGTWADVDYASQEGDIAWTMEGWLIPTEGTISWDISWEWLYGELSAGRYRIGKEIMNFRGPGDSDTEMVYTEFTLK